VIVSVGVEEATTWVWLGTGEGVGRVTEALQAERSRTRVERSELAARSRFKSNLLEV